MFERIGRGRRRNGDGLGTKTLSSQEITRINLKNQLDKTVVVVAVVVAVVRA